MVRVGGGKVCCMVRRSIAGLNFLVQVVICGSECNLHTKKRSQLEICDFSFDFFIFQNINNVHILTIYVSVFYHTNIRFGINRGVPTGQESTRGERFCDWLCVFTGQESARGDANDRSREIALFENFCSFRSRARKWGSRWGRVVGLELARACAGLKLRRNKSK
jgi:hypothetical protein